MPPDVDFCVVIKVCPCCPVLSIQRASLKQTLKSVRVGFVCCIGKPCAVGEILSLRYKAEPQTIGHLLFEPTGYMRRSPTSTLQMYNLPMHRRIQRFRHDSEWHVPIRLRLPFFSGRTPDARGCRPFPAFSVPAIPDGNPEGRSGTYAAGR